MAATISNRLLSLGFHKHSAVLNAITKSSARHFSFTFAGPRSLDEIIKKELVEKTTKSELEDIWKTYHDEKQDTIALVLSGEDGKNVTHRANQHPFFVQPIFRDNGFFMMVSQFQAPAYFLLAYLEDYKMDPHSATPLLTFSVFNDYATNKDVSLIRCDILNRSIDAREGKKVVQALLDNYRVEESFQSVKMFNENPNTFDIDDYISQMNERWKSSE